MPLYDPAPNAPAFLDTGGIGERPVVFVTHSMGGLLVKEMIRNAISEGVPRWEAIAAQTRGVCFIATPHSGANLANYVKFLTHFLATVSVEDLRRNEPNLRQLNNWYRN